MLKSVKGQDRGEPGPKSSLSIGVGAGAGVAQEVDWWWHLKVKWSQAGSSSEERILALAPGLWERKWGKCTLFSRGLHIKQFSSISIKGRTESQRKQGCLQTQWCSKKHEEVVWKGILLVHADPGKGPRTENLLSREPRKTEERGWPL